MPLATTPAMRTTFCATTADPAGHNSTPIAVCRIVCVCNSRLVPSGANSRSHQSPDECAPKARRNHQVFHTKVTLSPGNTPGTCEPSRDVSGSISHSPTAVRHATGTPCAAARRSQRHDEDRAKGAPGGEGREGDEA